MHYLKGRCCTYSCPPSECYELQIWAEHGVGFDDILEHATIRRDLLDIIIDRRKDY